MVESHAPVLEMLWEAEDPHHALGGRFGFSDGKSAEGWVAANIVGTIEVVAEFR